MYRYSQLSCHFIPFLLLLHYEKKCNSSTIDWKEGKSQNSEHLISSKIACSGWTACSFTKTGFSIRIFFFGGGGFPEELFFRVVATLHKKWSFQLRISSVILETANCGFGDIYWGNRYWKTFFCALVVLHIKVTSRETLRRMENFILCSVSSRFWKTIQQSFSICLF